MQYLWSRELIVVAVVIKKRVLLGLSVLLTLMTPLLAGISRSAVELLVNLLGNTSQIKAELLNTYVN